MSIWRLFQPWTGLVVGTLAAGIAHQFGADGVFDDCGRLGPGPLQLVAILCIMSALVGGWLSLPVLRAEVESRARRLIATISVGMAILAGFATILPLIASLILPPCFQ